MKINKELQTRDGEKPLRAARNNETSESIQFLNFFPYFIGEYKAYRFIGIFITLHQHQPEKKDSHFHIIL